ncbi:winged helix-turn-helix domain-containing protein [Streptomyces sp. NBC_00892]|uniref:winged helix-turn-helix domain-containing protein n=1 Tax=Streptomyces sp. NBC_00892 TaxID=2975861 RepID=UPI0022531886|nr:winged helix-turn-helix domain-containing protein [Streptomyces sp. NBC_00892]MCX4902348.1 winged helix-turn-helix domain-containing protein [Streptomyces sp. NBC_00892]
MSAMAVPAAVLIPAPRSSADGDAVGVLPGVRFRLVVGEEQDVLYTASRRSEPRAWLRSVVWLVAAGLHPEAGPSTVVVAEDLAGRMDYRRGIVVYGLKGTARRTGLSPATVKRHVKVLRELGALVWLVYGSKRNLVLPGEPYMATATIYGAVIPPVFDEAMGHRLTGTGYEGRVCGMTEAGRERAVAEATARSEARHQSRRRGERHRPSGRHGARVRTVRPVDNPSSQACEPHSLGSYHRSPAVQVESGCKDTSRERASCRKAPRPSFKISRNSDGSRRTAGQTKRGVGITQQVRPRVPWTQRESLRALEVALRPFTDAGWDWPMITAELHSWMLTWRPARPAAYIRARLAQQAASEHQTQQADLAEGWDDDTAAGPLTATRPDLVHDVLAGLRTGLATYSARQAEQGLDDLSARSAAADMAAFLTTTTGALA